MAFSGAYAPPPAVRAPPAWHDAACLASGALSLAGACAAAVLLHPGGVWSVALLGGGVLAFGWMLVLVGRSRTRRWLAFGAMFGFAPWSRRPLHDLGTDRPVLHGRAGRHPARLRLVVERRARGVREWLEVETDVLTERDAREVAARAREAAREAAPDAVVRASADRLALRAPFSEAGAPRLVDALARVADAVEA